MYKKRLRSNDSLCFHELLRHFVDLLSPCQSGLCALLCDFFLPMKVIVLIVDMFSLTVHKSLILRHLLSGYLWR